MGFPTGHMSNNTILRYSTVQEDTCCCANVIPRKPCGVHKHKRLNKRGADARVVALKCNKEWSAEKVNKSQQEDTGIGPLLRWRKTHHDLVGRSYHQRVWL